MPTYVLLLSWTDQGIRNVKDTLNRADAAAGLIEGMGGKMTQVYWTLGPYDVVTVIEAPDDETATAFAAAASSQGNIRTTTMRAFDRGEVEAILGKLP